MAAQAPMLRAGERIRPFADGRLYRVERVSESAAHIREEYREPVLVSLPGGRTFQVRTGGGLLAISARAQVERA